jgi:hypothetical protein
MAPRHRAGLTMEQEHSPFHTDQTFTREHTSWSTHSSMTLLRAGQCLWRKAHTASRQNNRTRLIGGAHDRGSLEEGWPTDLLVSWSSCLPPVGLLWGVASLARARTPLRAVFVRKKHKIRFWPGAVLRFNRT